jgi:GT2 family glycosyltransferase
MKTLDNHASIIIPNWNGLRHLQTCLSAVLQQTYPSYQVVLVDDGSTDGSSQFVAENFPQVRILRSERNLGFTGATNLGMRSTEGQYVAILNNDTQVEPNWLEELVRAIESGPRTGMAASKLLFHDRRDMINSAGIAVDRVGIAWDRCGGDRDRAETQPYDVFGPSGGAALYRRAMLDEVGLFDEDYFIYLEDVDLAWRGQAAGWRCAYVPTARVYHVHSATMQEGSPFKNYLLGRNKWWTIFKDYPHPQLLIYLPLILAYDLMAVGFGLVTRRDVHGLRGRLAALKTLPTLYRKRRALQTGSHYSPHLAYACLDPVESPWDVRQRYKHLRKQAAD